jgi:hypothetical protein
MELQISEAFTTALGLDNAARQQAEAYLLSISLVPGFLRALASLASYSTSPVVQLSTAVHLKNSLVNWLSFSQDERSYVKSQVIANLRLSTPDKLRSQFAEITKRLWDLERPWESALEEVQQALASPDADVMYGGLNMLMQVVQFYEYTNKPALRSELYQVTSRFLPLLLNLLEKLIGSLTEASFQYISLVVNTLWCACYIDLPPELLSPEVYLACASLLNTVLKIDLGSLEHKSDDEADQLRLDSHPAWQSKRWSIQLLHRLFQRYDDFTHPKYGPVARVFYENLSGEVLSTVLCEVFKFSSKHQPSLYKTFLMKFLTQALKYPPTLDSVKPRVGDLVTSVILPALSRVPKDEELWNDDSVEFIRKENDLMRSYFSHKSSCIDFLVKLCERGYLDAVLVFLAGQVQSTADLVLKEALLLAIGSLENCIAKRADLVTSVEPLLKNYVMADLVSPIGFARMRAVWMYSQFAKFPLKDVEANSQVCTLICKLMMDEALPVQIEAAIAIPKLAELPIMSKIIKPELHHLIGAYLKLMDRIDSEDLVEALEQVVETYGTEIAPFAVSLASSLSDHFFRMASVGPSANQGESQMAAATALSTIDKIIDAFEHDTQQLKRLAAVVYPILEFGLSDLGCEFYEEALHMLTYLLYYAEAGAIPELVSLYPLLIKSVMGDGSHEPYASEVEQVFAPLANFISKYASAVVPCVPSTLALASYLLAHDFIDLACKVWLCLLESVKDAVLPFLPAVLQTVLGYQTASKVEEAIMLLVVCEAVWFLPSATAEVLGRSAPDLTARLLSLDPAGLSDFYVLRVLVLGLAGLLEHALIDGACASRAIVHLIKVTLKLNELKGDKPGRLVFAPAEDYAHLVDGDPKASQASCLISLSIEEDLYDSSVEMVDELGIVKRLFAVQPTLLPRLQTAIPEGDMILLAELLTS